MECLRHILTNDKVVTILKDVRIERLAVAAVDLASSFDSYASAGAYIPGVLRYISGCRFARLFDVRTVRRQNHQSVRGY